MVSVYAFFDKDIRLLTMQDGLADNTVSSICKDADGFMWFGTNNGLSRYDGKIIKNFRPMEVSAPFEKIVKLSKDYLGVIAGNKLYCFNRKSECFTPVISGKETDGVRLWGLLPLNETSFWAIFEDKLLLYQWKEHKDQSGDADFICANLQKEFKLLSAKGEFLSAVCFDENLSLIHI